MTKILVSVGILTTTLVYLILDSYSLDISGVAGVLYAEVAQEIVHLFRGKSQRDVVAILDVLQNSVVPAQGLYGESVRESVFVYVCLRACVCEGLCENVILYGTECVQLYVCV